MPSLCPKPLKACAMRVTLLDECGVPVDTTAVPNSQIVIKDFISLGFTPEIESGDEFTQRNACGDLCYSSKDCDVLKWWNISLELCGLQPHLEELLGISNALTAADGTIIGGTGISSSNNDNQTGNCSANVAIEIFSQNSDNDACAGTNACPYIRYMFPLVTQWAISDGGTFTNGIPTQSFSGVAYSNGSFNSPLGIGADPDLTPAMITTIQEGNGFAWVCTSELPEIVECDYVNPA